MVSIEPHDLRWTYARQNYDSGMDLISIQQNLGHAHLATPQGYIWEMDASARRTDAGIEFDLSALKG